MMNKIFKFVKVGGAWFYWSQIDTPENLAMTGRFFDSLGDDFVMLKMVDPTVAEIILSKLEETKDGAIYLCKSKNYNDKVYLNNIIFNNAQNIYLNKIEQ